MLKRSSNLPRRQLGRYLRELRHESGLPIAQVARLIGRGVGTVQRLETGEIARIKTRDIEELCLVYDSPEWVEPLKGLAQQANAKSWWHEYGDLIPAGFNVYVGLEAAAERLTVYRPDMVSGLFQTPDYARALDRIYFDDEPSTAFDRRVQLRMRRQRLIRRKRQPASAQLVVDEGALRQIVGDVKVMAAQLRHLADLPPNAAVHVLPAGAGFPLGISPGPFTILDFKKNLAGEPLDPTVVYVESYAGDLYLEGEGTVRLYRQAHNKIRSAALSEAESKLWLRRVAKEYSA